MRAKKTRSHPVPSSREPSSWASRIGSGGPDHFMELVFERDARGLVRALDTRGFVCTTQAETTMWSEFRGGVSCRGFDFYADVAHNAQLLANLCGEGGVNVWHYQVMMVSEQLVWLEHGYGASTDETLAVERRLLERAVSPASGLRSWSIEFGGQGYRPTIACAGRSSAELAAALHHGS